MRVQLRELSLAIKSLVLAVCMQAVSTTLHIAVDSISGLPRSVVAATDAAAAAARSGGERPAAASKVVVLLVDTTAQ